MLGSVSLNSVPCPRREKFQRFPQRVKHLHKPAEFVGVQREEGHKGDLELARAANALESIQEDRGRSALDTLDRLADSLLGACRQQPFLQARLAEPIALKTEVQLREFEFRNYRPGYAACRHPSNERGC